MDYSSSLDISEPSISLGKSDKAFNFFMFVILIIIFFILVIPWDKLNLNSKREGMSGGTLTQLFAQDSQDVYLKSNVDKIATSNFDLYWNMPTRVANFQNRGSPLPSIYLPDTSMNPTKNPIIESNNYTDEFIKYNKTFPNPLNTSETKNYLQLNKSEFQENINQKLILPNISQKSPYVPTIPDNVLPSNLPLKELANSNPYELSKVALQSVKTHQTKNNLPRLTDEMRPIDYLYQTQYNNLLYNKDCMGDPASCGSGSGGYRLGEDYNKATTAKPFVNIDGTTFYPDSYTGSFFMEPNFNIMRPIPFMPGSNLPPNPVKIG